MNKQTKILGLFFTLDMSVEKWHKLGLLDREKLIYERLIENGTFKKIYWFTYGSQDKKYSKLVNSNIIVISKPRIFVGFWGSLIYSFLMTILKIKYLRQCDIFKTNQMWGSWSAVFSKWLFKKLLFVRTGYTASKFFKYQNRRLSYFISLLVEYLAYHSANISSVTSESDKIYIQKKSKIDNIHLMPNFVNTNIFKNYNIEKNKDLIFIGRLEEQKNLFSLLKALQNTNLHLDLYGSGALKNQLLEYANKLNINANFYNLVPHNDLPKILNQYKIYILCSYYEGMSKTLIEAMTCGLACIGTKVEGITEIIKHQQNGWLVGTTSEDIRKGIQQLLSNEYLMNKLGTTAREYVVENFSLLRIFNLETNIYNQLLKDEILR